MFPLSIYSFIATWGAQWSQAIVLESSTPLLTLLKDRWHALEVQSYSGRFTGRNHRINKLRKPPINSVTILENHPKIEPILLYCRVDTFDLLLQNSLAIEWYGSSATCLRNLFESITWPHRVSERGDLHFEGLSVFSFVANDGRDRLRKWLEVVGCVFWHADRAKSSWSSFSPILLDFKRTMYFEVHWNVDYLIVVLRGLES
jgi:hypothetical protein